jgi:predicted O-methyltransferase YrrM
VAGVPFMSPEQGRIVYDHVRATRPADVLELGTAHGVGAAYLAAALEDNGAGRLTTVDFAGAAYEPSPESVLARAGVAHRVDVVRAYSSYTWWLKEQVQARSDAHGNCEPRFDFVYLDGAKNWTIDGLAVVLVEKLLRPGGWLLMDDLDWTYAQDPHREATDGIVHRELSEPERAEPHLRAVFDLIVAQHPSFTELRVQDEWWGWARKAPGEPRRYRLETSRPLAVVAANALRRAVRRARLRARR